MDGGNVPLRHPKPPAIAIALPGLAVNSWRYLDGGDINWNGRRWECVELDFHASVDNRVSQKRTKTIHTGPHCVNSFRMLATSKRGGRVPRSTNRIAPRVCFAD